MIVELERPEDADAVDAVVRRAFAHHVAVGGMVTAIRRSQRYHPELAFVARTGAHVVGFVMLSGTDLVDEGGVRREVLTLTPLAVAPECQRRGVGTALVQTALRAAQRVEEPLVVLEGSPQYYGRLGFQYAGDHGITIDLPEWAPSEAAQVFLLPRYDPTVRGHIEYPPAIAEATG